MIELKIPLQESVSMLTERMEFEYELRKITIPDIGKSGLKELPFNVLLSIAEVAAFDLIFLLPAEVYEEENNIPDIVTNTMRALAGVYDRKEFLDYPREKSVRLVEKIARLIKEYKNPDIFSAN